MRGLLNLGMYVGIIAGFFPLLNRVLFELSSMIGSPTVIAGLGWTMDVPVIGWLPVQIILTALGFGAAHLLKRDDGEADASENLPF